VSFVPGGVVGDDLEQRRDDLRQHPDPDRNGIDYVDVDPTDHRILRITFLRDVPPKPGAPTKDGYGLADDPASRIVISGGTRIVGITAVTAKRIVPNVVEVVVDKAGDLGTYLLGLDADELDPPLSTVLLSFAAPCPTDVACRTDEICPPDLGPEPLIDYLAKDYASFRRLLLDLAHARNPRWNEDNPADLAVTVLEMLAYEGDRISYFQDAVATEAYLDTARVRKSVRRHARLVDYSVHDGRNAWTSAVFTVASAGLVPAGTPVLTAIERPLGPGAISPPGIVVDPAQLAPIVRTTDPPVLELPGALRGVGVFETTHAVACSPLNNEIQVHTWGRDRAALPAGTTEAYLFSVDPATGAAARPVVAAGDLIVFEEVRGVTGPGVAIDADPAHRQAVRIDGDPKPAEDGIYSAALATTADGRFALLPATSAADALPLLWVRWRREDALAFPLCLATTNEDGDPLRSVAVARGNVALADHGQTVTENLLPLVPGRIPVELQPTLGPLTQQAPASAIDAVPGACDPAVTVTVTTETGRTDTYTPVPDLLDSGPFDANVVAEVDDAGFATLRFGDGEYGADPSGGVQLRATYRVGNGPSGNIGADALVHVALASPPAPGIATVTAVRNPLAARGGAAAESLDAARVAAPEAFRADQRRAITEPDYAAAAMRLASVQGAVARFRWTGSWWTVFVGIDPADPVDLVDDPDGRSRLSDRLTAEVLDQIERFRQAGYDLEVRAPTFVPVELVIDVCVLPGHFRADVLDAVRLALSRFVLPDGRLGFFHPTNWTFGKPLWLSAIYAAVEQVEGVDSLTVTRLRRLGQPDNGELDRGLLAVAGWEIVRCDNDRNFAEHGVLTLSAHGGKG